jgi:hypothetical protein
MSEERLVIKIRPDGTVHYETHGFQGADCLQATQNLSTLGPTLREGKTPDFYKPKIKQEKRLKS